MRFARVGVDFGGAAGARGRKHRLDDVKLRGELMLMPLGGFLDVQLHLS